MTLDFLPVKAALDTLANDGHSAQIWLRDDDAVSHTKPLQRLEEWARGCGTNALLAVIPARAEESLAAFLHTTGALTPCVHGSAHTNHALKGEKSAELGPQRPLAVVCNELEDAKRHLDNVLGKRALPVLVPPWNRMDVALPARLPGLGFTGLSAFGTGFTASAPVGLKVANTHLDVIDWRGARNCRPHDDLVVELAGHIAAHGPASQPTGILTHHLVHDEAVWHFLDALAETISAHPTASWTMPFSKSPVQM